MKNQLISALIIILTITSSAGIVSANETEEVLIINNTENKEETEIKNESERIGEKVITQTGGSKNVSFEDGYNGYCINKGWGAAKAGDVFTVQNTSMATNSINKECIGNYLKILFVDFHDFAITDSDETAKIIWNFSDRNYESSTNEIIQSILLLAENGRVIADHGEVKKINNTTEAIFDFEVLDSQGKWDQNFFGYKITYRTISAIENTTPENTTTQNETQTNNNTKNSTDNENVTVSQNETVLIEEVKTNTTTIPNSTDENTTNQTTTSTDDGIEIDTSKVTGNPLLLIFLVLVTLCGLKFKRD